MVGVLVLLFGEPSGDADVAAAAAGKALKKFSATPSTPPRAPSIPLKYRRSNGGAVGGLLSAEELPNVASPLAVCPSSQRLAMNSPASVTAPPSVDDAPRKTTPGVLNGGVVSSSIGPAGRYVSRRAERRPPRPRAPGSVL